MITFNHILCPIDLSDISSHQLSYAAAFARWYGARLTVLHVVPTFDPMPVHPGRLEDPMRIVYPMSEDDVTGELGRAVEQAGLTGPDAAVAAAAGDAVETIVDRAVALPADLLVMGTHGRSGFDRVLLGSVTEKVLRQAPCPVLTVPPHAPDRAPATGGFRRILCPMDFSPAALQALGFALDLARHGGGSVTLLHVLEFLPGEEPRTSEHFNVPEYRRHLTDEAHQRLRELAAGKSRAASQIEEVVATGRAYREVLATAAERQVDLIVMGSQGRGAVGLALFGSTTQQVVRAAECPVLTVRGTSDFAVGPE